MNKIPKFLIKAWAVLLKFSFFASSSSMVQHSTAVNINKFENLWYLNKGLKFITFPTLCRPKRAFGEENRVHSRKIGLMTSMVPWNKMGYYLLWQFLEESGPVCLFTCFPLESGWIGWGKESTCSCEEWGTYRHPQGTSTGCWSLPRQYFLPPVEETATSTTAHGWLLLLVSALTARERQRTTVMCLMV